VGGENLSPRGGIPGTGDAGKATRRKPGDTGAFLENNPEQDQQLSARNGVEKGGLFLG